MRATLKDVIELVSCYAAMGAAAVTAQPDGLRGAREAAGDVMKRIRQREENGAR